MNKNGVPELTHLQYIVLCCTKGLSTGVQILTRLRSEGIKISPPAFYQLLKHMRESGLMFRSIPHRKIPIEYGKAKLAKFKMDEVECFYNKKRKII